MAYIVSASIMLRALLFFAIVPWAVQALWPIPRSLQTGSSFLRLSSSFLITLNIDNAPQDLLDAVMRTRSYIYADNLQRLVVGRGANDSAVLEQAVTLPGLSLSLQNGAPKPRAIAVEAVQPLAARSEGYSLHVPSDGSSAVLTANSTLGLFRGLTTFEQLWYNLGNVIYSYQAPVTIINDVPAYQYRGFMLDTARNFFTVSDIKRTLDAMSWVKINMFHWHIVDSQSFPLEVPNFPEIAEREPIPQTRFTLPPTFKTLFHMLRGIDILMEIDTPGHTAVIATSHPEHIACPFSTPWSTFANEPPAGQLRLASPATSNFTVTLLSSIAKSLPSSMFSTGGDEVNTNCYAMDSQTQQELQSSGKTLEQAFSSFVQTNHAGLAALGKTPVVWEEMVLAHTVALQNNTIVMVWISSENAAAVAAKNFHIVHAPSDYFYLDCGAGEWLGNDPGGNSWCDPFKTWQKSYTFDPLANLTQAQSSLVLGGQQLLWTEQSAPENLDPIVWPRAASSAEIFWTGATLPDGTPRNVDSALPRLHDLRYRMVQRGVRAIPLQPHWCALRPGVCDLTT